MQNCNVIPYNSGNASTYFGIVNLANFIISTITSRFKDLKVRQSIIHQSAMCFLKTKHICIITHIKCKLQFLLVTSSTVPASNIQSMRRLSSARLNCCWAFNCHFGWWLISNYCCFIWLLYFHWSFLHCLLHSHLACLCFSYG